MTEPTGPSGRPSSSSTGAGEYTTAHSEFVHGAYPAISVLSYLLAGPLTFGLIGWGADQLLGTGFLLVVGLLFGMGLAFYVIWLRYGRA